MSGKHDKAGDEEQSANLLLTGPIVIRGLGRGVKDAFRPGRPSRHRAFVAEGGDVEVVRPTPVEQMLTGGPSVDESGPASDLTEHTASPAVDDLDAAFPTDADLDQTDPHDGPGEDRVDDRADDAAPADAEVEQSGVDEPQAVAEQASVDDGDGQPESAPDGDAVEAAAEAAGYDEAEAHAFVETAAMPESDFGTGSDTDTDVEFVVVDAVDDWAVSEAADEAEQAGERTEAWIADELQAERAQAEADAVEAFTEEPSGEDRVELLEADEVAEALPAATDEQTDGEAALEEPSFAQAEQPEHAPVFEQQADAADVPTDGDAPFESAELTTDADVSALDAELDEQDVVDFRDVVADSEPEPAVDFGDGEPVDQPTEATAEAPDDEQAEEPDTTDEPFVDQEIRDLGEHPEGLQSADVTSEPSVDEQPTEQADVVVDFGDAQPSADSGGAVEPDPASKVSADPGIPAFGQHPEGLESIETSTDQAGTDQASTELSVDEQGAEHADGIVDLGDAQPVAESDSASEVFADQEIRELGEQPEGLELADLSTEPGTEVDQTEADHTEADQTDADQAQPDPAEAVVDLGDPEIRQSGEQPEDVEPAEASAEAPVDEPAAEQAEAIADFGDPRSSNESDPASKVFADQEIREFGEQPEGVEFAEAVDEPAAEQAEAAHATEALVDEAQTEQPEAEQSEPEQTEVVVDSGEAQSESESESEPVHETFADQDEDAPAFGDQAEAVEFAEAHAEAEPAEPEQPVDEAGSEPADVEQQAEAEGVEAEAQVAGQPRPEADPLDQPEHVDEVEQEQSSDELEPTTSSDEGEPESEPTSTDEDLAEFPPDSDVEPETDAVQTDDRVPSSDVVPTPEPDEQPDAPTEEAAAAVDEHLAEWQPEDEADAGAEATIEDSTDTPVDAPEDFEAPTDEPQGGRDWSTAEELFGLPTHTDSAEEAAAEAQPADPIADFFSTSPDEEPVAEQQPDAAEQAPADAVDEPVAVVSSAEVVTSHDVPEPAEAPAAGEDASPVEDATPVETAEGDANAEPEAATEPERAAPTEPEPNAPPEPASTEPEPAAPPVELPLAVAAAATTPSPAAPRPTRPAATTKPKRPARPPRGPRPQRERFGREAAGIAVLVVLALICAGLITGVVLKTRHDAAIAASEAANYTPPPLATPEPSASPSGSATAAAAGPLVAVIGDGSTTASASGVTGSDRWNSLLASSLDSTVDATASSGMGYVTKGASGSTFVQAAAKVPAKAQVVVLFGGSADSKVSALALAKAATNAFAAVKKQAPDAKIIVVGPAISAGASSSGLTTIRNTLRSTAGIAKATWVDPIADTWLSTDRRAGDPTDLTKDDEKTIASKIQTAVTSALG